ncbi:CaiB/BaiF CoA transferase family protein [Azospirillum griseum]|uniref:CoA transferase n=1 Tax=Azospirillum griseum TaxID=2496639 RepID=A0A3S0IBN2_9PROT|nr:CoA transferase [Azospirillum griseum]RTR14611.1 CoA transferase [Azospirillum griseum]
MTAAATPLAGLRVVDLTTFLSGPYCTQILGDLGAEVLKVERTDGGDSSRAIPPHFVGEDSAYYLSCNRNKGSIAIDLKSPDGVALVRRLIARADVVIENYRPGVATRLGLDPEALRREHPALIWASISGFGQTGPWRDLPAYDMIVQALSGVMSLTGEEGRPAVRLGIPAGDMVAGMYAAIAVTSALAARAVNGQGRLIDVSMLDCQLSMLSYQGAYALVAGTTPKPQGARHDSIPTYRSFRAGDGRELVVTANTEGMWRGLCQCLGLADRIDDPRFANGRERLRHKEALWAILEPAFLTDTAVGWVGRLSAAGVPAAPIKTVPEALADARAHGRRMVVEMDTEDGRSAALVGNPMKLSDDRFTGGAAEDAPRFPPRLGEDSHRVLAQWLGMDVDAIDRVVVAGVVGVAAPLSDPA